MKQKENKNSNEQIESPNNFINKKRKSQYKEEANKKQKHKKQKKEVKNEKFSKELENLIEYKYNDKGELVHKRAGTKCERLSKQEYEIVGMYVQKYVENLLIKTFNLDSLYIPNNISSDFTIREKSQAQCKILTTKDFPKNSKCLMLIQGTGAVRLGQWARSVCINENIDLGSMKPYIEKAIQNKFSVIILNPNERKDLTYENKIIKEFPTMEKHSVYVYNNIVKANKNIKDIYIVAHSMGGECTIEILLKNKEDLLSGKIKKIAFTDSVHGEDYLKLGKEGVKKFREISRNFITSDKEVGKFIKDYNNYSGVNCYSAGDKRHEYTSGKAIDKVFEFFNSN